MYRDNSSNGDTKVNISDQSLKETIRKIGLASMVEAFTRSSLVLFEKLGSSSNTKIVDYEDNEGKEKKEDEYGIQRARCSKK